MVHNKTETSSGFTNPSTKMRYDVAAVYKLRYQQMCQEGPWPMEWALGTHKLSGVSSHIALRIMSTER